MANLLALLLLAFAAFTVYATYKQDRDPDWAFAGVIVAIFILTLLGGAFGWETGYRMDKDATFLIHWHVFEICMTIVFASIALFVSTILLISGLAIRAQEKGWNELAMKLTRMMNGVG